MGRDAEGQGEGGEAARGGDEGRRRTGRANTEEPKKNSQSQEVEWGEAGGQQEGAVEKGAPEMPTAVPPLRQSCKPSGCPLTCPGQGASGTARLGGGVLPKLRQEESQATKFFLHLLDGEASMRGVPPPSQPHPPPPCPSPQATTSSCFMVSSRLSSFSRISWVWVGLWEPPPGTPSPSRGGPAPLSSSEGNRSCFRDRTGRGKGTESEAGPGKRPGACRGGGDPEGKVGAGLQVGLGDVKGVWRGHGE